MTTTQRPAEKMRLGLFIEGGGHHIAAWRHPGVDPAGRLNIDSFIDAARTAERACFDMIFTADTNATFGSDDLDYWMRSSAASRLEPLTMLSAVSAVTQRIGLVATMSTTYSEPFTTARVFASLDQISRGRAGWNLVTSLKDAEARNFGKDAHAGHGERYARAREFAQVVMGLWESWDDDAMVYDQVAGIYMDPGKMHVLNHRGAHFSVRGPLMIQRSRQGRPVIVQAGGSEEGRELAAETAEVVFSVQQDLEPARAFYADLKARVVRHGRRPEDVKVLPGVMPVVGRTRAEAAAKYEELQELIQPEVGVKQLSNYYGVDLSQFPLDGPLPEIRDTNAEQGRRALIADLARRENHTIRSLYKRIIGQRAHRVVIGSAAEVADALEEWFTGGACDGFNVLPATFPAGLRDFCDDVIPELQRRGLFRTAYEGTTLRENLGLPFPAIHRERAPGRE
ncbi:LLM class flavin-dependent oxidoreductase [Roseomonas sp. BN140053]|uniref:LLM class flavin-dependent oxidoreductase n=1 Tax=Roseomonas sp. BN140053 TaxID=3391898 RepID=UPI0039E7480C